MNRALLIAGTLLILAVLNLNRSNSSTNSPVPDNSTANTNSADTSPTDTDMPPIAVAQSPRPARPGSLVTDESAGPNPPRSAPTNHPATNHPAPTQPAPDDRPLPAPRSTSSKSLFSRTIGEHFQSHPSTESRIVRLRELAERGATGQSRPPVKTEKKPKDWIDVVVDLKNRSTHVATKTMAEIVGPLSLEEEWSTGKEIHDQLIDELKVDASASDQLLTLLGQLQSSLVRTKHQPYTLTVIEDEKVNAFSHLGGHVYVCRGLLDLVHSENELLFVIGHEVGHIELGHCVLSATGGVFAERTLGELAVPPARVLQKLMALSYSEHDEFDADAWSYKTMRRLGKSDRDTTDFFHTLLAHQQPRKPD